MLMIDHALAYAKKGFIIFPCNPDKKPYISGGFKVATTDEQQIKSWWSQWPDAMIGFPTGKKNGLWVLDVDRPKKEGDDDGMNSLGEFEKTNGKLPQTLMQKTQSGGIHYFYRYPSNGSEIRNRVNVLPKIDVRGEGGYIIIAPSKNENGIYKFINDSSIVDAPQHLISLVLNKDSEAKHENATKQINSDSSLEQKPLACSLPLDPYVEKALQNNMQSIAEAPSGTRNDTLFKAVAFLAGFIPNGLLDKATLHENAKDAFRKSHPTDFDESEFEKTFASAVKHGIASPRRISDKLPSGFIIKNGSLYYKDTNKKRTDNCSPIRIGSELGVIGLFRDKKSSNWGKLLEWRDPDGVLHRFPLTNEQLSSSDASIWRAQIAREGYSMGSARNSNELLRMYITACQPTKHLQCVLRTGWHDKNFVFPHKVIPNSDAIVLINPPARNPYTQKGSLDGWQKTIGAWLDGNSRLLFSVCAALSGPLLDIFKQESGGFNLTGSSSIGKTTAILAAASVWGKGSLTDGYIHSWRSTDNGLEALACIHSDTVICLDELSQVSPYILEQSAYMLGNSQGKSRAYRNGNGREVKTWRTVVLSTGEQGLAEKLAEGGRSAKAGQAVRLIDIPADAEAGLGLFENIHGFSSPQEFSDVIKKASSTDYGHAGPAFIEKICSMRDDLSKLNFKEFADKLYPQDADGQVKRVASRFALCLIAGCIATYAGILPVSIENVHCAVKKCFKSWLKERCCCGNLEDTEIIERLKAFISSETGRFQDLSETKQPYDKSLKRAGFRTEKNGKVLFYIISSVFKEEIFKGINPTKAARILCQSGILSRGVGRLTTKLPQEVKELGRPWVYAVCIHDD